GAEKSGLNFEIRDILSIFPPQPQINAYKSAFTVTDDPGFGVVNTDGRIADLLDKELVSAFIAEVKEAKETGKTDAFIVYGCGAGVPELNELYDLRIYFDKPRQPVLWEMWAGRLIPFGESAPDRHYQWKDYYYCDHYLLERQKEFAFKHMDFWIEGISLETLKLVPRKVYDTIIQTLVEQPVKEVTIFQPGPWGAYRYRDLPELFEVPGLECNAWNELAGPELSILVDFGGVEMLKMPMTNLMQYPEKFVGRYLNETYPHLFPLDVWLDDGYFPKPAPAERTSMPIHNHPGTDYVKRHFKEPLGRYETYYIAEAYEGANTWLGYKDSADMEEWERLCRESNNLKPIPAWKDYIANWDSNVGDLYLIPPGTVHAHGGNQMVLEMDTCPSISGTEYSFFTYDYARNSWDDNTKTMTGKPCKMHLDHSFDNDKFCRESWIKDNLLAKPKVIKWTKEFMMDRYSSDSRMPFEIERFHFDKRADNDTEGKFLHILTLTVGEKVALRSKTNSSLRVEIVKFQSVLVPACFGEYEIVNAKQGACTIVQIRWKQG
ncbi:MAG: hypothetical protein PHV82_14965, partial [Victivallaceae bacterium]|nr:hypothetical protein [Victivallaceae bacterium]